MQKNLRLRFMRGDGIVIILIALLAAAVFFAYLPSGDDSADALVEIYQEGRLIRRLPLNQDVIFDVAGDYVNTVCISAGRVSIEQSDCPGGDCMHTGWISSTGRSIVCLPNRVEVRISGAQGEVDFVVG